MSSNANCFFQGGAESIFLVLLLDLTHDDSVILFFYFFCRHVLPHRDMAVRLLASEADALYETRMGRCDFTMGAIQKTATREECRCPEAPEGQAPDEANICCLSFSGVYFRYVPPLLLPGETNVINMVINCNNANCLYIVAITNRTLVIMSSHPRFNAVAYKLCADDECRDGLTAATRQKYPYNINKIIPSLASSEVLDTLCIILMALLVSGHLVWWVERKNNPEEFPPDYLDGVDDGLW